MFLLVVYEGKICSEYLEMMLLAVNLKGDILTADHGARICNSCYILGNRSYLRRCGWV